MAETHRPQRFVDRYVAHGLRRNPFAAPEHDQHLGSAFTDRGLPEPPPPGALTLVQLIGDPGAGKSSQLRHWQSSTPGPFHWIPRTPYRSRWETPPPANDGIVYGDEIDRMPAPLRHRWFRQLGQAHATLIIGTHVDLGGLGQRHGFEVRTHHLGPVAAAFPTSDQLDHILSASGGNLREADVLCHRLLAEHVG